LPALRARIPGHFLGERLEEATQVVEQVVSHPRPVPSGEPISEVYQAALAQFRERQGLIDASVWHSIDPVGPIRDNLTIANTHLALNIMAALTLGDMDFLGVDIEWIEGLLGNHQLPSEMLYDYLNVYRQAANTHLDERGAPVVDWLTRVVEAGSS
jgi:hypothetical protein